MAIGQRQAPFNIHITSLWPDPAGDDGNIAWTRELSAMKPFTTGRVYVNYIGDEGEDRVVAAFGPQGYARLQALKDRYDPANLFRSNQNIKPSGNHRVIQVANASHASVAPTIRRSGCEATITRAPHSVAR